MCLYCPEGVNSRRNRHTGKMTFSDKVIANFPFKVRAMICKAESVQAEGSTHIIFSNFLFVRPGPPARVRHCVHVAPSGAEHNRWNTLERNLCLREIIAKISSEVTDVNGIKQRERSAEIRQR